MKVNVDKTLEVNDEQRVQIANVLDGVVSKRQATREEMKEFIWNEGSAWEVNLKNHFRALEEDETPAVVEDEDLIGGGAALADEDDGMGLI